MVVTAGDVLRYRMAVGGLSAGEPLTPTLAEAARAGLQDGAPWSGLLSLHIRVAGVTSESWKDASLSQVFGPRGAVYLVPREDVGVFTLGVFPTNAELASVARRHADLVLGLLGDKALSQGNILAALPEVGGSRNLRWAGTTGELLPVWDTRDTVVSAAPPPAISLEEARFELARRFFRFLGPATVDDLKWWLDTSKAAAAATVAGLMPELESVATSEGPMLVTADTAAVLEDPPPAPELLLLPPEDPIINRRTARPWLPQSVAVQLWPKAPPPGAVLIGDRVAGVWRRRHRSLTVQSVQPLSATVRQGVEELAARLPLPSDDEPQVAFEE